jgi:hypothetical protein
MLMKKTSLHRGPSIGIQAFREKTGFRLIRDFTTGNPALPHRFQ